MNVETAADIHYVGQGIGRRHATGTARVIKEESDWLGLPADTIVIVAATTPEMLPYLAGVRGIVAEQAGRTSHAALVARELGIPAVLAIHNARLLFNNGQILTLDGALGKITVSRRMDTAMGI